MKFMVTSVDAIGGQDSRRRTHSEYFPQVVHFDDFCEPTWEEIVEKCFVDKFSPRHGKQYLVVRLTADNARIVTFKHKQPSYDVDVQRYS